MTEDLRKSLKQLKDIAPQLNATLDQAAEVVRLVEESLDSLNLNVKAMVSCDTSSKSRPSRQYTVLCYGRVNRKFRVSIDVMESTVVRDDRGDLDGYATVALSETPWLEASREDKLLSFPKLPELLERVYTNALKAISNIQEATPKVQKILASMK